MYFFSNQIYCFSILVGRFSSCFFAYIICGTFNTLLWIFTSFGAVQAEFGACFCPSAWFVVYRDCVYLSLCVISSDFNSASIFTPCYSFYCPAFNNCSTQRQSVMMWLVILRKQKLWWIAPPLFVSENFTSLASMIGAQSEREKEM